MRFLFSSVFALDLKQLAIFCFDLVKATTCKRLLLLGQNCGCWCPVGLDPGHQQQIKYKVSHNFGRWDGGLVLYCQGFNTLRPRQNGRYFVNIFRCIFFKENIWILIKISLNCVPKGSIHSIPALVQILAWRGPGDKPLSEPMMVSLLTHICITRPQWVNIAILSI